MSCNHPLIAIPSDEYTVSGKRRYSPVCAYDRNLQFDYEYLYPGYKTIPCGKCAGCRAAKAKAWADRMILELDHSKKAVFLTLTYDNEHLPVLVNVNTGQGTPTLQKRDLQLFLKRLRKAFKGKELRYYAVGEYGSRTLRPH